MKDALKSAKKETIEHIRKKFSDSTSISVTTTTCWSINQIQTEATSQSTHTDPHG